MGNNKKFILGFFLVFAVMTFASLAAAAENENWTESSTPDISNMEVYVNDALAMSGSCDYNAITLEWDCVTTYDATPALEKGEAAHVEVIFTAGNITSELDNAKVKAEIRGYSKDIEAETAYFDIFANNGYTRGFVLDVPSDMDEDEYTLYVVIENKNEFSGISEAEIDVGVQKVADMLKILSVDSYGSFEAGSVFYADVVVKNTGSDKADDVYVSVSVPELGLSRTVYLGDLDDNDDGDNEDAGKATVSMLLPSTAKGSYALNVKAYDGRFSVEEKNSIAISGTATGNGKVVITPQAVTADIGQGKGAVYTMTVTNSGSESLTVKIGTEGTDGWAEVQTTPQTFVLDAGKTETVNVYLVANENAIEAEHVFTVEVSYGNNKEQLSLNANVTKDGASLGSKTILMIVAIVLAVAIIVLLIVLLTRKETKEVAETYY